MWTLRSFELSLISSIMSRSSTYISDSPCHRCEQHSLKNNTTTTTVANVAPNTAGCVASNTIRCTGGGGTAAERRWVNAYCKLVIRRLCCGDRLVGPSCSTSPIRDFTTTKTAVTTPPAANCQKPSQLPQPVDNNADEETKTMKTIVSPSIDLLTCSTSTNFNHQTNDSSLVSNFGNFVALRSMNTEQFNYVQYRWTVNTN